MFRECRNCGADFYKEAYAATCPDCNRQLAAEQRAENAAQRDKESRNGYNWGYDFYEDVGLPGRSFTFELKENGGLSFTVDYLDYFLGGRPNAQFIQGMRDRLDALGWGRASRAEKYQHIKAHAYSAAKSPNCHQSFYIPWEEAGLVWRLSCTPRVKFINSDYKRKFVSDTNNVLDINGILVYRQRIFSSSELQGEFDRGLRDYVLEDPTRAQNLEFQNTVNTEVYVSTPKRWLLVAYLTLATIGIINKFQNGFGWVGLPAYIAATVFIWKHKSRAWNSIFRGPLRYTIGLHFIMSFLLLKLNDLYGYILAGWHRLF
jgi:hypothetical protein